MHTLTQPSPLSTCYVPGPVLGPDPWSSVVSSRQREPPPSPGIPGEKGPRTAQLRREEEHGLRAGLQGAPGEPHPRLRSPGTHRDALAGARGGQEGRMEGKGRSLLSLGSQLPRSPPYRVQMPSSSAAPSLEPFWVLCAGLVRAHLGVFGERRAGHLLWGRPWLCCLRGPAGPRGSQGMPQAVCCGWAGVGGWGGQSLVGSLGSIPSLCPQWAEGLGTVAGGTPRTVA